jgi:outer membrane protein
MMKKLFKTVILAVGLLGASSAFADTKIGVLDMEVVMQKSPQVAQLNQALQSQFKPQEEKVIAARKSLQDEVTQLNKNAAVMKDADKAKLQNKIIADKDAYDALAQSFSRDLGKAQRDSMQKFMKNVQTAVAKVAKEGSYTLIVNRAAVPYMDPSMDVTKQVLDSMAK